MRLLRATRRLVSFVAFGVAAAVAFSSLWVLWHSASRIGGEGHRKWVIVLGDRVEHDGAPSPYLRSRLETALAVVRDGRAERVLVSGNARSTKGDEVAAMHQYLVERGVVPSLIADDRYGVNTYNTCSRARAVFGIEEAIVVTQDFHLRRAIALCTAQGIDAIGVQALADVRPYLTIRNWVRELVLSRPKAMIEGTTNPGPKTLER
ncbi:vancomycin high temperature exclusion protein [Smaragdicoccus niigatensis]|uniref:SanA/YdcF family protein n=1 Tax=Smaragdicoccus niigatensis TaxID=359359 RepID=UPI00036493BF|nr:ElyC/SanA/YdcF family protein [Smaragdicoccus niigatensis]